MINFEKIEESVLKIKKVCESNKNNEECKKLWECVLLLIGCKKTTI